MIPTWQVRLRLWICSRIGHKVRGRAINVGPSGMPWSDCRRCRHIVDRAALEPNTEETR